MKTIVNPEETARATAYKLWIHSPMPMVTVTATIDVTRLVRASRRRRMKFNILLCHSIGEAASGIENFRLLPEAGKLYRYDKLAISVIVTNVQGGLNFCEIPYSDDIEAFNDDYLRMTEEVAQTCKSHFDEERMIIGTSALPEIEIDSIVSQYTGTFHNPFVAWGRYRRSLLRYKLPVSLQFHHVAMDGSHAVKFFIALQNSINKK